MESTAGGSADAGSTGDLILAIDAGTQSMRAGLVDPAGNLVAFVKTAIDPYFSANPGWAEQDPEYYWVMLARTTRQLLEQARPPEGCLAAVTLTTQRLTMVNVDADGRPLRPAIVWLDQRKADMRRVVPAFARPLLRATGQFSFFEYVTEYSRSNWIRQNQPELWEQTDKFLYLSGFLTLRLTGLARDSSGNIIGTIPFDVKRFDWAGKHDFKWRLFPIEREKLPELVQPADLLGEVTKKASFETGIPEGLPVFAASNDKACDVIGSGCLSPERACISLGTTATLNTQNRRYVELRPFLPPYPSAVPGESYTEVRVVRGLWMVSWFKEEFGLQERIRAEETNTEPEYLLEQLVRDIPPGSMGLVCQPYWTPGPELAPFTKGAVFGFGDVHTRAHLYRAILEGIVFALREGAELTQRKTKVAITELRATGGGSRSDSIMQMIADVFGLDTYRPHTPETSVIGAAIDAAVGLGWYPDVPAAVGAMTRVGGLFTPDGANRKIYDDLYRQVYLKIYRRLLPLYQSIQEITGYPEI
jgi:sugar (pentulose or hexulose) kinase